MLNILILIIFYILVISNKYLSKELYKNRTLQLLIFIVSVLSIYNNVHVGFQLLGLTAIIMFTMDRDDLDYNKIMKGFKFKSENFNFKLRNPFVINKKIKNKIVNKIQQQKVNSKIEYDDTMSDSGESEFDDNVSEIDPNDYVADIDPSINDDINSMVSKYINTQ